MLPTIIQRYELLPRPDYPAHAGTTRLVYSSAGQIYSVRSNGVAWVADSVVHVGTLATLPTPATVPIGSRAVITDRGGIELYSSGTAWLPDGLAYQGALASLPAPGSAPVNARAVITDVRNIELYNTGTDWRPINGHAIVSQLEADFAPSTTPGTTERTAATVALGPQLMRAGSELRLQLAAEKLGGTADTLTIGVKINATLIYQSTLATNNANMSADLRFLIASATTIARRGHGDASTTWGGKSTTARPAAGAINDVTSATNTLTVTFTMGSGATEYGRLTAFGVEVLS